MLSCCDVDRARLCSTAHLPRLRTRCVGSSEWARGGPTARDSDDCSSCCMSIGHFFARWFDERFSVSNHSSITLRIHPTGKQPRVWNKGRRTRPFGRESKAPPAAATREQQPHTLPAATCWTRGAARPPPSAEPNAAGGNRVLGVALALSVASIWGEAGATPRVGDASGSIALRCTIPSRLLLVA